jgi:hypothetical protein
MRGMPREALQTLVVGVSMIALAEPGQAQGGLEIREGLHPHRGQTVIYRQDDAFKGWAGGLEYTHATEVSKRPGPECPDPGSEPAHRLHGLRGTHQRGGPAGGA